MGFELWRSRADPDGHSAPITTPFSLQMSATRAQKDASSAFVVNPRSAVNDTRGIQDGGIYQGRRFPAGRGQGAVLDLLQKRVYGGTRCAAGRFWAWRWLDDSDSYWTRRYGARGGSSQALPRNTSCRFSEVHGSPGARAGRVYDIYVACDARGHYVLSSIDCS